MRRNRSKWFTESVDYLIDNLFDILTIISAAYIVVRSQFQPYAISDIPHLATWIIGVLGLLSVSEIWERRRRLRHLENLAASTNEMVVKKLGGQTRAQDFFWPTDKKVIKQDFDHAKDIFIVGMVLNRTIRDHLAVFGDLVTTGTNLRFVLVDPEKEEIVKMMALRSYGTKPGEWWKERILQTSGHIEDIQNKEKPMGTVTVGYLSYLPSFGMWLINPYSPEGKIFVEIYHHRSADPNATFTLSAADDAYWYIFFRDQYEKIWKSCETAGRIEKIISPQ